MTQDVIQAAGHRGTPRVKDDGSLARVLIWVGLVLVLMALPHAADAGKGDPTVAITDYQVTPAILLPGDQGTIMITLANTAGAASATESTVQNGISGTTTTTTTKDISVLVESVYLYGKGVDVLY